MKLRLAFLLLFSIICFPMFTQTAFAYNRGAAASYADNWAYGRNPNFYHYSVDCTSFASESMYAGGDSQNRVWHGDQTSLSGDWDNAPDNYAYEINFNGAHLVTTVNLSDQAYFSTYDSLQAGDMLYSSVPDALNSTIEARCYNSSMKIRVIFLESREDQK